MAKILTTKVLTNIFFFDNVSQQICKINNLEQWQKILKTIQLLVERIVKEVVLSKELVNYRLNSSSHHQLDHKK